jgi:AcrR family transcriptional regulator
MRKIANLRYNRNMVQPNEALIRETSLERALATPSHPPPATPLDALAAARQVWIAGERLDMGALAARLGTSRATLYRWVGSRERLLGEVAWSFAAPLFENARRDAHGGGPARVADAVERYLGGAVAFAPLRRFIEQDPEYALRVLCSKHSPMQRRSVAATRELLEEEIARGKLTPPLELDTLAYLVVRIGESLLYNDIITGGEPDVAGAADAVEALLSAPRPRRRARRNARAPKAGA